MTLSQAHCLIKTQAEIRPNSIAVQTDTSKISYHELNKHCNKICQILHKTLQQGDTITIVENITIDSIALLFSCFRLGVLVCIINPKWPVEQIAETIQKSNSKKIYTNESTIITLINKEKQLLLSESIKCVNVKYPKLTGQQLATILPSSGSSGVEKLCLHRYSNHFNSAKEANNILHFNEHSSWLNVLPYHHVSGLSIIFRCMLTGGKMIISKHTPLKALNQYSVTHTSLVLPQLKQLLGDDYRPKKELKCILLGGSPFPENTLKKAIQKKLPIRLSYGLTESSSFIACTDILNLQSCLRSSGKVNRITKLTTNNYSQLLLKGQSLFFGYLKKDRYDFPFDENGWFNTRDVGTIQSDSVIIKGRLDTQFISGGENIFPEEIESILMNHSAVDYAIITPIKDPDFGHVGCAYILSKEQVTSKLIEDLIYFTKSHLPNYKCPKYFHAWPEHILASKAARQKLKAISDP